MRRDRSEYNAHRHLKAVPHVLRPLPAPPRRRPWAKYAIAAFVVYMLVAALGRLERETQDVEARQYCEMVHLWKTSAGDLGWPDYAGTYARQCTPGGKVRAVPLP